MCTFSSILQYETHTIILIWNVLIFKCWQHTSQTVVNSDLKVAYYQIDESEIKLHAKEDKEVEAFIVKAWPRTLTPEVEIPFEKKAR